MYDGASGAESSKEGREGGEKEVRIARGSRGAAAQTASQITRSVISKGRGCEFELGIYGNEIGDQRCVRTTETAGSSSSSLDSLFSIASSNNKTDVDDDDELPFHLLQHSSTGDTPYHVHVGDCVCARLEKSGGAGFPNLARLI